MASEHSLLAQYQQFVNPYNMDVIAQGMAYKQQKIDANREAIERVVDNIAGVYLLKEEDQEYLNGRLSSMASMVNSKYKNMDLSDPGVARSIQGELSRAIDEKIVNARSGTIAVQKLQSQIESIRTSKPDQYSDINHAIAMAPVMRWLNDGKVGSRVGGLSYTPYSDVRKGQYDDIMKFVKENPEKTVDVKDNQGNIIRTKISGLTPTEVINFLGANLSAKDINQLNIEAQYAAMQNPEVFTPEGAAAYIDKKRKGYRADIMSLDKKIEGLKNNSVSGTVELNARKEFLEKRLMELETAADDMMNNFSPFNYSRMVVMDGVIDSMATAFGNITASETYMNDQAYFNRQNLLMRNMEHNHRVGIDYANLDIKGKELGLKMEELELKRERLYLEATGGISGGSGAGSKKMPISTDAGMYSDAPVNLDEVDITEVWSGRAQDALLGVDRATSGFIGSLDESERNYLEREVENLSKPGSVYADQFSGLSGDERLLVAASISSSVMNNGALDESSKSALLGFMSSRDELALAGKNLDKIVGRFHEGMVDKSNISRLISEAEKGSISIFIPDGDKGYYMQSSDVAKIYKSALAQNEMLSKEQKTPEIEGMIAANNNIIKNIGSAFLTNMYGASVSKKVFSTGDGSKRSIGPSTIPEIQAMGRLFGLDLSVSDIVNKDMTIKDPDPSKDSYPVLSIIHERGSARSKGHTKSGALNLDPSAYRGIQSVSDDVFNKKDITDEFMEEYKFSIPKVHSVSKEVNADQFNKRQNLYMSIKGFDPAGDLAGKHKSNTVTYSIMPSLDGTSSYKLYPNGNMDLAIDITRDQAIQMNYDADAVEYNRYKSGAIGDVITSPVSFSAGMMQTMALNNSEFAGIPASTIDLQELLYSSRGRAGDTVIQKTEDGKSVSVPSGLGNAMNLIVDNYNLFDISFTSGSESGGYVKLQVKPKGETSVLLESIIPSKYDDKFRAVQRAANQGNFAEVLMNVQSRTMMELQKMSNIGNGYPNVASQLPSIKPIMDYIAKVRTTEGVFKQEAQE